MSTTHCNVANDPYREMHKRDNRLKIKDTDKFKNITEIDAHISTLYKTIGAPLVPGFGTDLSISSSSSPQQAVRQIADFFGLGKIQVSVTFVDNLGSPGRVHLSPGDAFRVEIDNVYAGNSNIIAAILAHEVAHIYLYKHGIIITDTLHNEIFTDTTAAFLGCASLILNSSYEEATIDNKERHVKWFGYITQYEVGYIQAKRDFLLRQDSSKAMIWGRSEEFFEAGRAYFLKHVGRPYVKRSAPENIVYRLKSLLKNDSIVFPCIGCGQRLRIPASGKTLSVRCATCGKTLLCYS